MKDTPFVVLAFNRLAPLRLFVEGLWARGHNNVTVVDSASFSEPLLAWYAANPKLKVVRLEENVGCKVFWTTDILRPFLPDWYVLASDDVVLCDECPDDFLSRWRGLVERHGLDAAGPELRTDDLPPCYPLRRQVVEWEGRLYSGPLEDGARKAVIDLTIKLCRPGFDGRWSDNCARTGSPYWARHLPWYSDPGALSGEDRLYVRQQAQENTHWTKWLGGPSL